MDANWRFLPPLPLDEGSIDAVRERLEGGGSEMEVGVGVRSVNKVSYTSKVQAVRLSPLRKSDLF